MYLYPIKITQYKVLWLLKERVFTNYSYSLPCDRDNFNIELRPELWSCGSVSSTIYCHWQMLNLYTFHFYQYKVSKVSEFNKHNYLNKFGYVSC